MRPLWWDFPSDPRIQAQAEPADGISAFMFGPKYLAAPVLADGVRSRTVYLPPTPGGWTHFYTHKKFSGGANITVAAPLDELPLFARTWP
jgi:alpha-D-xyloside xylohydrolase